MDHQPAIDILKERIKNLTLLEEEYRRKILHPTVPNTEKFYNDKLTQTLKTITDLKASITALETIKN